MTSWAISVADTFFHELLNLPQSVQKRVSKMVKILERDPISAQGDAKKLKGYLNNVYRVRIGDYRLFYSFGQSWVKLLSVRKRDERTYETEIPEFEAPAPPPKDKVLEPQIEQIASEIDSWTDADYSASEESVQGGNVSPAPPTEIHTSLPTELTKTLLKQWQIPAQHWPQILQVSNAEELLELPLPDNYLERILDNLYPRPIEEIATQRDFILKQPEDLDRFVAGDLSTFLLKLDPDQEQLRDFGKSGPTLVKGGPGTGKSTLALHRVQTLLQLDLQPVLFTTYTKALVAYSQQLLEQLLEQPPEQAGVEVSTVDALTYRYYTQTYGKPRFTSEHQCLTLLETALKTTEMPGANVFDRQVRRQTLERLGLPYLLQEIEDIIEGWGLTRWEAYRDIERRGRGKPLKATLREAVWRVYQTWQTLMKKKGLITWPQLRYQALEVVTQLSPPYQALVIDEAQDLSPVALRLLLALVPSFDGVYLTADASQSLYQRGFSWKQIHADLQVRGRTLVLRRNYRNTQQIALACADILQDTDAGDPDCLVQESSPHQGEPPTVVLTDSTSQETQLIQSFLTHAAKQFRLPIHGGAILCPNSQIGKAIAHQLTQQGMTAQFVYGNQIDIHAPYIKVLTLYSAKGLEFPFVVVVGLQEGQLPYLNPDLPAEEIPVATDAQRRLFYVGCSRAMRALTVYGSRSRPSPFIDSLTEPHWKR